ncbi:MAG: CO dehydrogenase/acetyl-CoA synthase complex subunit epsilon [Methanobacteriaceae archaeon]|jgi:acetyl-CoA decarbonylase/synthase complex subunit epsilon
MVNVERVNVKHCWQLNRGLGRGDLPKTITPEFLSTKIKKAKRPLFIFGPSLLEAKYDGKLGIDYAVELLNVSNVPVIAVGHAIKGFLERGFKPDAFMPVINIIDRLKDPNWEGIRGEGQHDLVTFFGVLCPIGEQGISTLKHFAPHLQTMTICPRYHPSADMSIIINAQKLNEIIEEFKK